VAKNGFKGPEFTYGLLRDVHPLQPSDESLAGDFDSLEKLNFLTAIPYEFSNYVDNDRIRWFPTTALAFKKKDHQVYRLSHTLLRDVLYELMLPEQRYCYKQALNCIGCFDSLLLIG